MRLALILWVLVSVAVLSHALSTATDPEEFGGSTKFIGSPPCSRDKMSGLMRPEALLECCRSFAWDLSQRSGGVLVFNHHLQFEIAIALMASLMIAVVVGSIIAAPQISRMRHKQRLLQQLGGAVLVCLPLFVGQTSAPVYDHFKASIRDTLHRTLIWSSAQTIELAVPVGWACLLPRTPTLISRSQGGLIFAYLLHQQVLVAVRRYAVRAIQWASEKAPGTLPILVETLILLCVLLFLTTIVPALLSFLLEIKSFCHARWREYGRSNVPTKCASACLWTALGQLLDSSRTALRQLLDSSWTAPNEASRSRRSREAWCLSVTIMLYVLGAAMPVFMLALVPGKDFQMLEFLAEQSDPLLPTYLPPYARRQAAHPIVRQSLKRLAGECKWDQQAGATRWNDTQLIPSVLRAAYKASHYPGVCGYTKANQNNCQSGEKGTLDVAVAAFTPQFAQLKQLSPSEHEWMALSECVAQCNMCDRCHFISFSLSFKDCSWFSKCDMAALRQVAGSFVTIPVMDAIPVALSSAGVSGLAAMRCTHNDTRQSCKYLATSVQNAVQTHLSNASRFRRWPVVGEEKTRSIQAATKSAKSGGRRIRKKASSSVVGRVQISEFIRGFRGDEFKLRGFLRWQKKRDEARNASRGKKRVTRSTQAATKSAKSGDRPVRKNASSSVVGKKRIMRSMEFQAATKSAKSGGRPVRKNASSSVVGPLPPMPAPLTWPRVSQKTLWLSRYTGI